MKNNYIDKIIEKWNDFNNDEYEIYIYTINDMIDNMQNMKNDMIIDDDTDKRNYFDIMKNINYCKSLHGNYIVIDTPCDDDILSIIQFDDKYNIIGFDEFQTEFDEIYVKPIENIYILHDVFQFFRKIDNTGLLQHIYDKWNYDKRDDDIYEIPCNVLSNIIKTWIK